MRTAKFVTRALLLPVVTASSLTMVPGSTSASATEAGNTYYVAPNGSDSAAGTQVAPWASIARAQAVANAGDTVYFRGGTYAYTRANSACSSQTARVDAITLNKSGSSGNPIRYWAHPGEKPVFDFTRMTDSCRIKGFSVTGNWLHLKGLEVTGVPQNYNEIDDHNAPSVLIRHMGHVVVFWSGHQGPSLRFPRRTTSCARRHRRRRPSRHRCPPPALGGYCHGRGMTLFSSERNGTRSSNALSKRFDEEFDEHREPRTEVLDRDFRGNRRPTCSEKCSAPPAGDADAGPAWPRPLGVSSRHLKTGREETPMAARVMKIKAVLVAVLLAVAASVYGGSADRAAADTATPSDASQIVADMGAGWNLGNQLEANANGYPSETAWGNPEVTQALIDKVHAAGFKTIRIPVSYLRNIGPGPDYTINSSWLNRVQEVVDYAYNRGMYVVINMHGDGFKTVNGSWLICDSSAQPEIKDKYQKTWQQIASKFQGYDQRLILESMNEEFDGQYGQPTQPCYSNINDYNQIFVDTVRKAGGNNTSRWLLVPGWNTNIDYTVGNYGFALPTDRYRSSSIPSNEQRIMISVHYYDPWDFTGEESGTITQWGPAATNPSKTSVWGQEDYLDAQLKKMHDGFVTKGYPVVVGEYGAIDKSSFDSASNKYRADFARTVAATAKKYGAVSIYWDNGFNGQYGFGLFDRRSHTVTQQGIVSAIMSGVRGG